MNADDVRNRVGAVGIGQFRKIGIGNKQQREQYAANIAKISHQGHSLLHSGPRQGPIWQALIDYQTVNECGRNPVVFARATRSMPGISSRFDAMHFA
jgi:hypothetical protein